MFPINPQEFLVKEIPDLHPLSSQYINFWRESKRKSIEGHWLGGMFMPPSLYFYSNFGTILLNKKRSNTKSLSRPSLRDLEWVFFRSWTLARGFSGFELDEEYSGNFALLDPLYDDELLKEIYPSTFNSAGERKQFKTPKDLLESQHPYHKGKPLYENQAYNLMLMGSRDTGKSYMVSQGVILHQWLINGATEYPIPVSEPIDITVGAELAHYSNTLLSKTKLALEMLPGSKKINGRLYPSPLTQKYKGSWNPGSMLIAEYKQKSPGGWEIAGSRSTIRHRTFKDNPFADQGTRPLTIVLEEIGMFSNLEQVYSNTKDNLRNGLRKTGTLMMLGTGGDMESGTIDASRMFHEPEAYDILPFDDVWENNGKIGLFIPAYLALNEYKDVNGYSDIERSTAALMKAREKAKTGVGGSEALNKEIQYRPIVPSEMFLSKSANIFPSAELRHRLTELTNDGLAELLEKKVSLFFNPDSPYNGVDYKLDDSLQAINQFPWKEPSTEGAIVIYEFPRLIDNKVPQNAYIVSCDPYRDNVNSGESFAAIYVVKTSKYPSTVGHDEIVASYIGRPYLGVNAVNEILYKLSLFYGNATIYFENAVGNVKDYFEKIKRLDLLATQPTNVLNRKAAFNTGETLVYGYPMSNEKIKWEALQYVRSWLLTERGDGKRNLDLIPDRFLLQQLISFTLKGNFDAVMSFVGAVIGLEEMYIASKRRSDNNQVSALDEEFYKYIINNKYLFNEKLSKTTSLF